MQAIVLHPAESADQLSSLANQAGGLVVSTRVDGSEGSQTAEVSLRVPAAHLDETRAGLRKMAIKVRAEVVEARDVTEQQQDLKGRLKNSSARLTQYVAVLKRASKISEILEVTEKINETQGEIEQLSADIRRSEHEVSMSLLNVSLAAQPQAQVSAFGWRPFYQAKLALASMIESMTSYADFMLAFMLRIPILLLWLLTAFAVAKIGWGLLVFITRLFFPAIPLFKPAPEE